MKNRSTAQRWTSGPRHNDGPAFPATMPVDTFLERSDFKDFVHAELAGLADFAFHGNGPRRGLEILRVLGGIALVGTKFVEVVVVSDVFEGVLLFRGAERALREAGELRRCKRGLR